MITRKLYKILRKQANKNLPIRFYADHSSKYLFNSKDDKPYYLYDQISHINIGEEEIQIILHVTPPKEEN